MQVTVDVVINYSLQVYEVICPNHNNGDLQTCIWSMWKTSSFFLFEQFLILTIILIVPVA